MIIAMRVTTVRFPLNLVPRYGVGRRTIALWVCVSARVNICGVVILVQPGVHLAYIDVLAIKPYLFTVSDFLVHIFNTFSVGLGRATRQEE